MARSRKKIGSLHATLSVQHSAFLKNMKEAGASLETFASQAVSVAGRALAKFGAIGTAVAGGGLTVLVKRSMDAVDALAKTSDKLGTTTEAMAKLQLAGKLANIDIEAMNKAVEVMLKNIGDAAFGKGDAVNFLKAMGLSARELARLPVNEQIEKLLTGIGKFRTQAERISAVRGIFGKGGSDMLNLVVDDMQRLSVFAEKTGIAISRFDAQKIEAANDAITEMRAGFEGVANTLAVQLAQSLTAMARWITGSIPKINEALSSLLGDAADKLDVMIKKAKEFKESLVPTAGTSLFLAHQGIRGAVAEKGFMVGQALSSLGFTGLGERMKANAARIVGESRGAEEMATQSGAGVPNLPPSGRQSKGPIRLLLDSFTNDLNVEVAKIRLGAEWKKTKDSFRGMILDIIAPFTTAFTTPGFGFGKMKGKMLEERGQSAAFSSSTLSDLGFGGFKSIPKGPSRAIENTVEIGKQAVALLSQIARNTGVKGSALAL